MNRLICSFIFLLFASSTLAHITNETDAFHDILHFVHGPFSELTSVGGESLEEIYHEMFEKAECEVKAGNCSIVSFVDK